MKHVQPLLFLVFILSLSGCGAVRHNALRLKKVHAIVQQDNEVENGISKDVSEKTMLAPSVEDSNKDTEVLQNKMTGAYQIQEESRTENAPLNYSDATDLSAIPESSKVEEGSPQDLDSMDTKRSFNKKQRGKQSSKMAQKTKKLIIEALFLLLLAFCLVALTGVFGQTVSTIGIVLLAAMFLTLIIVLIYNYSQGS